MSDKLLTPIELCQELHIGKTKVYQLIKDQKIPAFKIGKKILVRESDLRNYIQSLAEK